MRCKMLVYDIVAIGAGVLVYVVSKKTWFPYRGLTMKKIHKTMSVIEIHDMNWFIRTDLDLSAGDIVETERYLESAKKYLKQKDKS